MASITRQDVLRYRDWWNAKIAGEELKAYSANRSLGDIKGMLTVVDEANQTTYRTAWAGLRLKETNATKLDKRLPFSVDYVQNVLLDPQTLATLNEDARLIVYTMVETGMRLGEVCNLRAEDVRLDAEVPHVEVADRTDRRQKTDHSVRQIPLVGVSLWAIRHRPQGFPRYADKGNSASAAIAKYMKERAERLAKEAGEPLENVTAYPTEKHTIYSLRHTFQDRIENAGASDRMQADLMGHEFGRPRYGDGPELKRRQALLDGIKFEWNEAKPATS